MYLYELALELDVRSTVLLDRAHALGINVDATAKLTPQQIEDLRSAYGRGRPSTEAVAAAAALPGTPGSDGGGLGVGAIAALVAAGLVVVLLAGYMLTNSGDEVEALDATDTSEEAASTTTTEPCDSSIGIGAGAIGQDAETSAVDPTADAGGALPPCDVAGGLSGDDIAIASTTYAGDPLDYPRDKQKFCEASRGTIEFEMDMFEASDVEALGPIRDVMLAGRDKFKADLVVMEESAPPRLDVPMDRYASVYNRLLDSVTPQADEYTLAVAFVQASRTDLAYYATQINASVNEHCSG